MEKTNQIEVDEDQNLKLLPTENGATIFQSQEGYLYAVSKGKSTWDNSDTFALIKLKID